MGLELARRVGIVVEIVPIGVAVAEQAVHDGARQRAVGAGLYQHRQVGLLHCAVHVDIDCSDLGAAFLARADRVGHHIDLGVHRIGAPDHHQIGFRHFARIDAGDAPYSGGKTGIGGIDADGRMKAGIFLDVAQPMDAVAHDEAHGAGVVVGPHRFCAPSASARRKVSARESSASSQDTARIRRALAAFAPQRVSRRSA